MARVSADILLPFEPAPVTRVQKALSARFLLPVQDEIFDLLMGIRLDLDEGLRRLYPEREGKLYPLGCCREISNAVRQHLLQRLRNPQSRAERAISAFIRGGGVYRPIWGALRGCYFQNATQFGSLYVDVSNDTVTVTKPKVEILPIEEAGLEAIRDIPHFVEIAQAYWKARVFANHVIPSLAPLVPVITVTPKGTVVFESASGYMIGLMMRNAFRDAQEWLASGPPPPPGLIAAVEPRLAPDLRLAPGLDGRQAAVDACIAAREAGCHKDTAWSDARVSDYVRMQQNAAQGGLSNANSRTSPVAPSPTPP
ncbi:hypothetical protein [Niveispirillum sp. KHB5.9]|uniref:hypothetical protein n=1 Tax=Niveispirillum sp. KHB5.9 TaxID=3400269 RepID=UPI003A8B4718